MKKLVLLLFLALFTLSSTTAFASTYDIKHLPLLAVQEVGNQSYIGSAADLYLEVRDGSGRVFLETSPLTKIDTQVSTRYAKEIACDYFDLDCENYDFIYTINARSSIIGGPSAGAAMAALTAISVMDLDYDESIAITGTINSGGVIGPVGGVKEKIEAAASENLSLVLIPLGSAKQSLDFVTSDLINSSDTNKINNVNQDTTNIFDTPYDNLIEYASSDLGIEVVEVIDLNDLLYYLTGKEIKDNSFDIEANSQYDSIMQELSNSLCERGVELEKDLQDLIGENYLGSGNNSSAILERINSSKISANEALNQEAYYSSASFCFGLNVYLSQQIYNNKGLSEDELEEEYQTLRSNLNYLLGKLDSEEINTISDLQTKMVVSERLSEVDELLVDSLDVENSNPLNTLAYAKERLYSAVSWMYFFQMQGKSFVIDDIILSDICSQKIAESSERYQYVSTYFPILSLNSIRDKISTAKEASNNENYELCIVTAAQAKADSSTILSSLGVTEDIFNIVIDSKISAVERLLSENTAQDIFPILGYSYYQYGKSLSLDENSYTSLIYLEYALELGDLDVYFTEEAEKGIFSNLSFNKDVGTFINGFFQGLLIGLLLMWLFLQGKDKRSKF